MKSRALVISACLLLAAQGAFATTYTESGDAADLPGSAQAVTAGTTSIHGNGGTGDVDMYSFIWGGGGLTVDSFSSTFDTQLFLFDASGFGVLGNDDHGGLCTGIGGGLESCLDLSAGLAAGTYYLAISAFNNDPLDGSSTAMMSCGGFTTQCTSVGGPVANWTGGSTTPGIYDYWMTFNRGLVVDTDGDGVPDNDDVCPGTDPGDDVDAAGCSDAQVDEDDDGVCDPGAPSGGFSGCVGEDLCPGTAPGDAVDAAGCSNAQVDEDADGVCDPGAPSGGPGMCVGSDACAATDIPEAGVPSVGLGTNRFALVDGNFQFDTIAPKGRGPGRSYTTADTAGCSCEQIIASCGYGAGHTMFGCSISVMDWWTGLYDQAGEPPLQCHVD